MSNTTLEDDVIAFLSDMADSISIFIRKISGKEPEKKTLAEFTPGDVVKIGSHEMVVLDQELMEGKTLLICKESVKEEVAFGASNNNYVGSNVESICQAFADEIAELVGDENIIRHNLDLTTLDGLKDYGTIADCSASLLTLTMYQRYVDILDRHKPDEWWWLATATSTKRHENDKWILCVSPSGNIGIGGCSDLFGVRPFCILKSGIVVSC